MADRECVRFVAVIGEDEMQAATVMLKNMASGEQQSVATAAVAALIAA